MTVLVGYLPGAEGAAAFLAGLSEARRRGEDLLVLNSPRSGSPMTATRADEDDVAGLERQGLEAGVTLQVRQDAHADDLVDMVLTVADEVDASVIVIGLRHRSAVGKLLMGSTAQRILLDSSRPVLAVKP
ncbi:universal stress protein [Aeromicrobium sp. CF4.19]|uniref:universal stress protein n=1 Tax=Aeromicrobium sp. CF4.19 TaxID=3373082 RepID=UPI003EE56EB5